MKRIAIGVFILLGFQTLIAQSLIPDGTIPSNVGMQIKGDTEGPKHLDIIKKMGVQWVRRGFIWESIEIEKGVYDFSRYDDFVKNCEDRNLSIIGCMAFSNKLYGHVKDEPARTAYSNFASKLVERYKDKNIIWEIWNEPNTMTFWGRHGGVGNSDLYAEQYTNLVRVTVPAMKKANPDCIILAGSVSNMWTESYKWMSYCFARGMLNIDWDIWSVHPYGVKAPEDYIEAYAYTRQLMKNADGDVTRKWINSERGFPVNTKAEGYAGGDTKLAFEYQAWHLVRQYLIDLLEGLPVTIWYEWGGKEGFAVYEENGTITPAFTACKVFVEELSGYKLDKRLPTENPRDFVLRLVNKKGKVKLAVWTAPPPMESPDKIVNHSIRINVNKKSGALNITDLYGGKGKIKIKNNTIEPFLSGSVQYIAL